LRSIQHRHYSVYGTAVTVGNLFSFCDRKSNAGLRIWAVRSAHPSDSWASCILFHRTCSSVSVFCLF